MPALPPHAGRDTLMFINAEMAPSMQVVTGAPYSATVVSELNQYLADGNRIRQQTRSRIYRDHEGRTRWEHALPSSSLSAGGEVRLPLAIIHDPVAHSSYLVDDIHKQVSQLPEAPPAVPVLGPMMPTVRPLEGKGRAGQHDGSVSSKAPLAEVVPSAKLESLGQRRIQGLLAEGTRSQVVIAEGTIGNDKPILIVTEKWTSPELGVTLLSRHQDPRFGETVYQLIDIRREAQARTLFEPPPDYPIRRQP